MSYISRRLCGWFDGVDDYVNVPDSPDLDQSSAITVEVLVRPNMLPSGLAGVVSKQVGGTSGYRLMVENNHFEWAIYNNNESYDELASSVIEVGRMYHVVGVFDSGYQAIYLNGQVNNSKTATVSTIATNAYDLEIGRNRANASDYFYGDVYIVRIYNRALSDTEIAKLSEDPFDPNNVPKDGLVGWWDFNKADWTNGILPDLSGNGNDGTIYGVLQRDVLVKRGIGSLPSYELTHSWVCDGIDDYCIVDYNNWAVTKAFSFAVWDRNYTGTYKWYYVKNFAKGLGYYDATQDAWRVDAGEVGYFFDEEIVYDETKFGRGIWVYVYKVQVDDNSQTTNLFRIEIVDANTGDVMITKDYTANQFPVGSFSGIVTAGTLFMPYGKYRVRLYSYGNVGFWIKQLAVEGYHSAIISTCGSSDILIYRYYGFLRPRVFKTDGSYTQVSIAPTTINDAEHFVVGWSNIDQKYTVYLNGVFQKEVADTTGLDMRGVATQLIFGANIPTTINNRHTGEYFSIMLFDRLLSDTEVADLYNKQFVLDGLIHWWVVDENGNLVDLVTGKSYAIQGNPYIRKIYDGTGKLNGDVGVVIFDIVKEERGN